MNTMLSCPTRRKFSHSVKMWTAGAPPPPAVIKRFSEELGVSVQTAYGLTESYGPVSTHIPDPEWTKSGLSPDETLLRSTYQSADTTLEDFGVINPVTMQEVPADGTTIGEIMLRGNVVMKGYLGNEQATEEAFVHGWFHTGDLGVNHGNGRLEVKDRSKDIIISGGENIASAEVENILLTHTAISEAAVVAMPNEKWGEVPCAFLTLRTDVRPADTPTEDAIIKWARTKMPGFQTPKKIIFLEELPKTSTGKVQKNVLRATLNSK